MSDPDTSAPADGADRRLYLTLPDGWKAKIKQDWRREYCYAQNPGEDFFHLLISGEVYLQYGHEKFCLNCAVRRGVVTSDRQYWQHMSRKKPGPAL